MEVTRRLSQVAVPLQVDLEGFQQRRAAGAVVIDKRRQHAAGEGVEAGAVFDLGEQPVHTQPLVVDDLLALAEAHHQVEGALRFDEGRLEVFGLGA